MMDFFQSLTAFILWGSYIWFWIIALAVFILFFVSESKDEGYIATIAFIVFLGVNFFWGNFPFKDVFTWRNVGAYLFVGLIFSLIKTYFHGRYLASKGENLSDEMNELKGRVFRWWFLWPISLLYWILSDLVGQVWDAIYQKLSKVFNKVLTAGFNSKISPTEKLD